MAGHTEGVVQNLFCAKRASTCGCGNSYQDNCRPAWASFKYPQKYKLDTQRRSYEAHHLLCVASVTKLIAIEPTIVPVVEQTRWCINHRDNLIAMPMWPHTLRYYCSLITGQVRTVTRADGSLGSRMAPPPFKDLPQHDYDHGIYIDEVDEKLKQIAKRVEKNKKAHKHRRKQLKSELNKCVRSSRAAINTRGRRGGGTHKSWEAGMNNTSADWYLAFSMAPSGEATSRPFPAAGTGGRLMEKLDELAGLFLR